MIGKPEIVSAAVIQFIFMASVISVHAVGAGKTGSGKPQFEGSWVVVSASWCGKDIPSNKEDKDEMSWTFAGRAFKHESAGASAQSGTYEFNISESPMQLDLKYTKGDVLAIRKCIFALNGNELKIAYFMPYVPGTPARELEEAMKMFAMRPKNFVPQPDESLLTLTLKRLPAKK